MGTSGTDTTPTSPNIFDLTVNRYGFGYPLFDGDNGDGFDVDVSDIHVDTNIEYEDEVNADNVLHVAQTPSIKTENPPHPVHLQKSQRVIFQRLENVSESVVRSLIELSFWTFINIFVSFSCYEKFGRWTHLITLTLQAFQHFFPIYRIQFLKTCPEDFIPFLSECISNLRK